jgi:hypothetical protein
MRGLRFFRLRLVLISVLFSYDQSSARMVELVDTRDLKSRGPGRVRAGSSPAPGTTATKTTRYKIPYRKKNVWADSSSDPSAGWAKL